MENQEVVTAKKHWWFWVVPSIISFLLLPTIIVPICVMGWTILRWCMDKIECKSDCLYSRIGVLSIDKKAIPLDKISVVSEKTNIFGEMLGFGSIVVQSSAADSTVTYDCIAKPTEFINHLNSKIAK